MKNWDLSLSAMYITMILSTMHIRDMELKLGKGAVVVLRPDGWLGTMMVLGREIAGELERYFERIFLPRQMLQHR